MSTNTKNYNENNIRLAAYYNWQNAGCPNGKDEYFWNLAIKQLYGSCNKSSCSKSSSTKKTSSSSAKSSSTKSSAVKASAAQSSSSSKKTSSAKK